MSRYSFSAPLMGPPPPSLAESLAEALGQGLQTYRMVRSDREARDQRAVDNQRATDYLQLQREQYANAQAERDARLYGQGFVRGEAAPSGAMANVRLGFNGQPAGFLPGAKPVGEREAVWTEQPSGNGVGIAPPTMSAPTIGQPSPRVRPGAFDRAAKAFTSAIPQPAEEVQVAPGLVYQQGRIARELAQTMATAQQQAEAKRQQEREDALALEDRRHRNALELEDRRAQGRETVAGMRVAGRAGATGGAGSAGAGGATPKVTQPSESERRAAALLTVAEDAVPVLQQAMAPTRWEAFAARRGLNEGLAADRQVVEQAASQVIGAYLYAVSGATAGPEEMQARIREVVPQPGETDPKILTRKRAALDVYIKALRVMAGRAAPGSGGRGDIRLDAPPEQTEMDELANDYKDALAAGADPAEARREYDAAVAAVARKHGRMP